MEIVATVISGLALSVSLATAWLTLFRRGTVKMSRPAVIFFGPDGVAPSDRDRHTKVFMRAILYATGQRGHIVESMFVRVSHDESSQNFNIWVHGGPELERGSGLYVGPDGVTLNHHFLPPSGVQFEFLEGSYRLEVFAILVGGSKTLKLHEVTLPVTLGQAAALTEKENGLYFDWGPDAKAYQPHIRRHPNLPARVG